MDPVTQPAPRRPLRMIAIIAGIPLLMLVAAVALVDWPFFERYTDPDWITGARDLYTASNRPCDIVIYGDSTAMVGIDPRIVSQRTHMRACNIAPNMNSIMLVGLEPLDRYLARNPRPKILLLQFRASNMHPHPDPDDKRIGFDGYIPMLRYGYAARAAQKILARPDVLIGLMHYTYVLSWASLREHLHHPVSTVQQDAGSYTILPQPPLSQCPTSEDLPLSNRNTDWVAQTRAHYAPFAGKLIFDAAPISTCSAYIVNAWNHSLSGLINNAVTVYPYTQFVDFLGHPTREGAIRHSNEIADQILATENQPAQDQPAQESH